MREREKRDSKRMMRDLRSGEGVKRRDEDKRNAFQDEEEKRRMRDI